MGSMGKGWRIEGLLGSTEGIGGLRGALAGSERSSDPAKSFQTPLQIPL